MQCRVDGQIITVLNRVQYEGTSLVDVSIYLSIYKAGPIQPALGSNKLTNNVAVNQNSSLNSHHYLTTNIQLKITR